MSYSELLEDIDDWMLGKKTGVSASRGGGSHRLHWQRSSYNKGSSGGSGSLKKGFGLENLTSAAQGLPEVMVKIPRRKGVSNGLKGIQGNLDYISRNGDLDLEDQDGNLISGKSEINDLLEDYRLLGVAYESEYREALNVVLSMPPNTDPQALKNAVREFAQETFPNNRWVMVQHLDTDHPHCHLNILMKDRLGRRLNPRKNDLYEWRLRFAQKLREQGIECAATHRQHRGKYTKAEQGVLRHIKDTGQKSYVYEEQMLAVLDAIRNKERPTSPYLQKILETQGVMLEEYGYIAAQLYKLGYAKQAHQIALLRKRLQNADTRTAAQKKYDKAMARNQGIATPNSVSGSLKTQPTKPTAQQGGISLSKTKDKGMDI